MNRLKSYIIGAAAMILSAGCLTSCQDDFDAPNPGDGPVATMQPNTSILEVKEWMWSNDLSYCDTVYTRDYYLGLTDDPWEGEHIIISGRVISSDYAGNCFKYIVLQDETAALNFSINSYNLYLEYRRGQEIVVDLTGMFMGKYGGLEQVGFPSWKSSINGYETSFMGPEVFERSRELNGMPNLAAIDTIQISSFSELGTSPSELRKWQSQLIRINNVTFSQSSDAASEGITTLSTYHSSGVSQTITASDGSTGTVRTSGYANFWNMEMPEGAVDVVLLVGYYGSTESNAAYQFTLIDAAGIITDPTLPKGSKDNPYSIGEAIEMQSGSSSTTAWVSGYLVGTVAPEVTSVTSSDDIEWGPTPILGNTMVIAPTVDCTDVSKCLVLELPQGSALYEQSLREVPSNYGKEFAIRGTFQAVMGTFGIVTPGTVNDFMIEGQGGGSDTPSADGDGSETNPYTCAQIIAMNPSSTQDAVESNVWVAGYVVGYYENYEAHFEVASTQRANILISDNPSAASATQCVCIQLVANTAPRTALNLVDNPSVLGQLVAVYGDVMKYNTLPGIKNTSKYALGDTSGGDTPGSGDTPSDPGDASGSGTLENPYNVEGVMALGTTANVEAYVRGYIVGNAPGMNISDAIFTASGASASNILLASSPACTDYTQCIPIQLSSGTDIRSRLNLIDNPGNIGQEVIVAGTVTAYFGVVGVKSLTYGELVTSGGNTPGGDNPGGDTPGTAVFNFTAPATLTPSYSATAGSTTDGNNTYSAVSGVTFTNNGVSVTATKGDSTDARLYYQSNGSIQLRVYSGSTVTISSTSPMSTISFDFNNASSALVSDGTTYNKSNATVNANGATSITFNASVIVQLNKITVVTE